METWVLVIMALGGAPQAAVSSIPGYATEQKCKQAVEWDEAIRTAANQVVLYTGPRKPVTTADNRPLSLL